MFSFNSLVFYLMFFLFIPIIVLFYFFSSICLVERVKYIYKFIFADYNFFFKQIADGTINMKESLNGDYHLFFNNNHNVFRRFFL
jgi:hypothetical protein